MAQDTAASSSSSAKVAAAMRPSTPTQQQPPSPRSPPSSDAAAVSPPALTAEAAAHETEGGGAVVTAAAAAAAASSPARASPRRSATPTTTSSPTATASGAGAHHDHHHHLPVPKTPSRTSPPSHGDSPVESISIGIPLHGGGGGHLGHGHLRPPVGPGGGGPPPLGFRGPLPGGAGGAAPPAVRRPVALCELTPVIRNTSELMDEHHHGGGGAFQDSFSSGVIVPDTGGEGDEAAEDRRRLSAAEKREQFLSLSVPASMGSGGKGSEGCRRGSAGLPGQLQQRPRRPLPQASPAAAVASVPIPPRASSSLRSSGGSSALSSSASGVAAAIAAASDQIDVGDDISGPPAPFLQMDSPPLGPRPTAAALAGPEPGAVPMPAPAVRSYSAGNLDMHSMVQTIREHLHRQQRDGGGCDDRDGGYSIGGEGEDDEEVGDAQARARLSDALEASWDSPARSLHRRPSPRALKPRDPREELTHQVGLPVGGASAVVNAAPPSILHPSLPRHPSPTEQLQEPYRPLREDSFEVGVKRVDRRELESIFKQGGGPSVGNGNGASRLPLRTPGTEGEPYSSSSNHPKILRGSPPRHPGASQNGAHPHIPPAAPLAERDWSIPSIRLANQFRGSSLSFASYTCSEDDYTEEDNIYRGSGGGDEGEDENGYCYDDEATISTAGSLDVSNHLDISNHLHRLPIFEDAEPRAAGDKDGGAGAGAFRPRRSPAPSDGEVVIEGSLSAVSAQRSGDLSDSAAAAASSALSASVPSGYDEAAEGSSSGAPGPRQEDDRRPLSPTDRPLSPPRASTPSHQRGHRSSSSRRKKKEQKNQEAIAWLKSVEGGGISEAASSKFLTGGGAAAAAVAAKQLGESSPSSVLQPHPMSRVISSPAAACVGKAS